MLRLGQRPGNGLQLVAAFAQKKKNTIRRVPPLNSPNLFWVASLSPKPALKWGLSPVFLVPCIKRKNGKRDWGPNLETLSPERDW